MKQNSIDEIFYTLYIILFLTIPISDQLHSLMACKEFSSVTAVFIILEYKYTMPTAGAVPLLKG